MVLEVGEAEEIASILMLEMKVDRSTFAHNTNNVG